MTDHHDHHDHFGSHNYIPPEVQADISAGKALFEEALEKGPRDEEHERLLASLEEVIVHLDEEKKAADGYVFNVEEFVDACQHVVADQLSAINGEKIDRVEFAKRFNRWFIFCDAVVNMGISCRYPKDALKDKEYEEVFKTLKLNKVFESTFLKPRRIRVELRHKSKQVMDKYPWLAMPVLVVRDKEGVEHEIAITPSPNASVWWLDILSSFHDSYNWVLAPQFGMGDDDDEEEVPTSSIDQPYPEGTIREEDSEHALDEQFCLKADEEEAPGKTLKHFGVLSSLNTVNTEATHRSQPIRAFGETEQRIDYRYLEAPVDYVRSPVVEKPLPLWKRVWNSVVNFFRYLG